uniref:olfactory receptor 52L1-like n=1 Tax=Monopterus albus TaxID=43700 RepID=UPI0009B4E0F7|nr:olfactory receptor 52L1-like [Monopterus albus]
MYPNTSSTVLLTLETLGLSNANAYPAVLFGILTYLLIMSCNLMVLVTIAVSKKLHKPMYILLFNLPVSDMVGATAFYPQLVFSIVIDSRLVSHPACVTQAFLIHVYGSGNLFILSAMAYDRYIAICCPLRYNSVMNPNNLMRITILIWVINLSLLGIVFLLLARVKICRTDIVDLYCNNPTLVKLACEDTKVNNYYGLFNIVLIQGGSLLIMIYTYAQILHTCLLTNQADARRKAIQTCGTHLIVYLIFQINIMITLISHRFESFSPFLRRALGVSILVFPPFLDPIIYGLKTTELKQSIIMLLRKNVGLIKM